jgi:hypothetical protein
MNVYLMHAHLVVRRAVAALQKHARQAQPGQSIVEFMVLAAGLAIAALIIVQVVSSLAHQSGDVVQHCFNSALTPVADATTTPAGSCH